MLNEASLIVWHEGPQFLNCIPPTVQSESLIPSCQSGVPVQLTPQNVLCDTGFSEAFAESTEKRCPIAPKFVGFGYDSVPICSLQPGPAT